MTSLTWLSHGSWLIDAGRARVLLDPFLSDNPAAKHSPADFGDVATILVSHGHFDHVGDVTEIAKSSDATVVAAFEVAQWFGEKQGLKNVLGMNLGGWAQLPWGRVKMVPAVHSSQLPDGSYGGNPAGFVLEIDERRIYFACDTALFSDMRLVGEMGIDVAVVPIGDLYTMGPEDSVEAIKLIGPRQVLPAHYNTWPPIEQDAQRWAEMVRQQTGAAPVILEVGETTSVT